MRAYGQLAHDKDLPRFDAAAFKRCCGSQMWADAMVAHQPFEDRAAMQRIAERIWWSLGEADYHKTFNTHPKIGERSASAWSQSEQAAASSAQRATLSELADKNRAYEQQYGIIYIVCASGRGADAIVADLRARLANDRARELRTAAEEQAKITRLRLARLQEET